ncbi:MAG TPA: RluA family pseudouridine synthase [Dehalococcoidia bacterium]|nr:RluA family pseudouridine synthase [Dehalococcoidia bacterium]
MKSLDLVADRAGERLDAFLARRCSELSRSHARRLIDDGLVSVEGTPGKPALRLSQGDRVRASLPPAKTVGPPQPEPIPVTVIYQDNDVLVVDKPAGLTVHPAPGHPSGTLVNALLALVPELRGVADTLRPGIVHRLDRDTSGLLVVAKNERAHRSLTRQLKGREVHKTYLALVHGAPRPSEGVIEAPIGRHPRNRKKMAIVPGGREAETRYRTRAVLDGYALLEIEPITGRTHQIRVHLAALGHPVVGDATYGRRSTLVPRQFLHAWRLAFALPSSGRLVEFESPLPPDLREALGELERGG